ncbi:MAG: sulfatase [Candidatus Binatia bacterium]|nr:sulfatase [Candidatus Binatia bacterium]
MRFARWLAMGLGWAVLVSLTAAVLVFAGRWVQVKLFPAPPEVVHGAEKAEYLAGLEPVDPQQAPNFVVIFFDDLGYGDLSSYGNQLIDTPRIDRLAQEGVRMTSFYSASPVCTPARAALLTGRYPVRSGTAAHVFFPDSMPLGTLRRMGGYPNELSKDEITVAEALGAAGYATGMIGKWHLGALPDYWPNDFGFDSYYGVHWSNDMMPLHVYRNAEIEIEDTTDTSNPLGAFRDEDDKFERTEGVDQTQLTRLYTEEAIQFIEQHREEPFFLYLAHTAPHVPHFADPEHAGESEGGIYGDVVEDLDRSTGAIVDAIDRLGLADRTLVIVTSDNGPDYDGSPGGLRGRKGETYEGGQRVPLIARWPGSIPPGQTTDAMGMNIDLFPTLLGLAGLTAPSDRVIDGRDLASVWESGAPSPHPFLFYFPVMSEDPDAVRDARFKYLAETGQPGRSKPTLTLVATDAENHNLILRHPEEGKRLAGALDEMRAEVETNPRGWR